MVAAASPALPLVIVPGQPGAVPVIHKGDPAFNTASLTNFLFHEGTPPSALTANLSIHAKLGHTRVDLVSPYTVFIRYFERHGYTLGQNLFVAVADWRLPAGPTNGAEGGQLPGLTAAQLTSGSWQYGADYVAAALRQASQVWAANHDGVPPSGVNVISHSYGFQMTRAYLASPDYGKSPALPLIHNYVDMGGDNEGASIVFNWLKNNFVGPGSNAAEGGLYPILNLVYQVVASGEGQVTRPEEPPITAQSIRNTQGQEDPQLFLDQYIPAFQQEMPTYTFFDGRDLNTDPAFRNTFLLAVNGGADPNRFGSEVTHVWDVFGDSRPTQATVSTRVGRGGRILAIPGPVQALVAHPRPTQPGEVWYHNNTLPRAGDTLVPTFSAVSTFASDPHFTLVPLRGVTHTSMLTKPRVERRILKILESS